jgi:Holliday junction resolvase RusA-like endonuclease
VKNEIMFKVPGTPKGKGRPKFAKRGNKVITRTPDDTVVYENLVKIKAEEAMQGRELFSGRVSLEARMGFAIPESWSKKKKAQALAGEISPTGKPDIDNVIKALGDAMNGVVFKDDSQICAVRASKYYGASVGITVFVEEF